MPSPFPGMDPYLESPDIWPDVHHRIISEIQTSLNPRAAPNYVARVELRVYVADQDDPGIEVIVPDVRVEEATARAAKRAKPANGAAVVLAEPEIIPYLLDDEIKEARLEIRHRKSGALVTIIEVLSPANKVRGSRGRESFMDKRRDSAASDVHWVEIDLFSGRRSLGDAAAAEGQRLSDHDLPGEATPRALLAGESSPAVARFRHSAARQGSGRASRSGRCLPVGVRPCGIRSFHRLSRRAEPAAGESGPGLGASDSS